jgi:predicted Co/Zn/Cd cation transporter (cation efflux family)
MKDFLMALLGIVFIVVAIGTTTYAVYDLLILNPTCLENGYVDSKITWKFDRYCIKRVDQTDVVISYNKVMQYKLMEGMKGLQL